MHFTVSDFVTTYGRRVRLVAGAGGLARVIEDVGILDYELLPGLRNRYQRDNFHERQLILSTFLYARDDAFLIGDAVRSLVGQGASALVVKNVFHLDIPESALRYAEARNFPIILVEADDVFFDEVILDVGSAIRNLSSAAYMQREVDALLADGVCPDEVRNRLLKLNPSMKREFVVFYAPLEEGLDPHAFDCYERLWESCELSSYSNVLLGYSDGLLAIISRDPEEQIDAAQIELTFRSVILQHEESAPLGVSEVHFDLGEGAAAITEALQAARLSARGNGTKYFADLGIMRAILPCCTQPSLVALSRRVLEPLRSFDAEHDAQLEETLRVFVDCGRSVAETARILDTHQNTVRYRLDQVERLCGLGYKDTAEADQLMLAVVVDVCCSFCAEA